MRRKLFCAPSPPPRRPAGRGAPSVTAPALPQKSWRGPQPAEAGGTPNALGTTRGAAPGDAGEGHSKHHHAPIHPECMAAAGHLQPGP